MKYERIENEYYNSNQNQGENLEKMLGNGETILWRGKPKKSAFIFGKVFAMAPFAILWLAFDSIFLVMSFTMDIPLPFRIGMWVFLLIHLLPVWIWISHILTASKRYQNTEYALTNLRVIVKSGFVGIDYQSVYYKNIANVNLKVGLIDRMLGVGDIYIRTTSNQQVVILDIEDCYNVYSKIQKIVVNIQTDIEYPNALRPDNNPGYNTKYDDRL